MVWPSVLLKYDKYKRKADPDPFQLQLQNARVILLTIQNILNIFIILRPEFGIFSPEKSIQPFIEIIHLSSSWFVLKVSKGIMSRSEYFFEGL